MADWVTSYVALTGDEANIAMLADRIAANGGEFSFDWFPLSPETRQHEHVFLNLDLETTRSVVATAILIREPSRLVISFRTAWAPVQSFFYEAIELAGYSVTALSIDEDGSEQEYPLSFRTKAWLG